MQKRDYARGRSDVRLLPRQISRASRNAPARKLAAAHPAWNHVQDLGVLTMPLGRDPPPIAQSRPRRTHLLPRSPGPLTGASVCLYNRKSTKVVGNLTAEQSQQYDRFGYFDVVGSKTGKRYRICHGTSRRHGGYGLLVTAVRYFEKAVSERGGLLFCPR
jgi:hypothetical protein